MLLVLTSGPIPVADITPNRVRHRLAFYAMGHQCINAVPPLQLGSRIYKYIKFDNYFIGSPLYKLLWLNSLFFASAMGDVDDEGTLYTVKYHNRFRLRIRPLNHQSHARHERTKQRVARKVYVSPFNPSAAGTPCI